MAVYHKVAEQSGRENKGLQVELGQTDLQYCGGRLVFHFMHEVS